MATRKPITPAAAPAPVLTHPAFDRPAVVNPRRRGPMGAVTLAVERRRRQMAARDAEAAKLRAIPPRTALADVLQAAPRLSGGDAVAGLRADDAVICEALALVESQLRRPGEVLNTPARVKALVVMQMARLDREHFRVLFLTNQLALISSEIMFTGTLTQTAVYPREVLRRALELNAGAVILAHNHPGGHPEPSRADELMTDTLQRALGMVDVRVIDHLVVGGMQTVSFAERGLLR